MKSPAGNPTKILRESVLDCGSPLPLEPAVGAQSGRGLPQSRTLSRHSTRPLAFGGQRILEIALAALLAFSSFIFSSHLRAAETARIVVQADNPGTAVPPTLHGLFFEDINYGADGGLYAELIQNRSFEDRQPLFAWSSDRNGRMVIETESPLNANNPHFLRVHVTQAGEHGFALANSGFDGIVLHAGEKYLCSLYARLRAGETRQLQVSLVDVSGHALAEQPIGTLGAAWRKFEATLTSPTNETKARLVVRVPNGDVVDLDMISLFPEKTFKGRRNGLRADLAQALADVKPGFLRFPGGCIVEGRDFANMYRWKDTIGDVAERKQNFNLWQDNRSPQYYQTYGLGFFEYFQLCEDIGAEPVPVINCGMCCQARRGPTVPLEEIGPYVQDALDLIEFANGTATSEWGSRRAAMGHPKPFNLKFLAVGNEQWQQGYFDRYDLFQRALKAKFPELKIISSAGPAPNDPLWEFAWNKFRTGTPADVVDEHYYVPPQWLMENGDRYDRYDRKGPKVFVGEYAGHDGRARKNNLRAALAEAAYMTSLWKNSDVVLMASYAPLFAKYGHDQWHPNLIWFDNSRVVLTPSYFAQMQFARNRPDVVLPTRVEAGTIEEKFAGMIGVGTWNTQAEYKDLRVTTPDGKLLFASDFTKGMDGWKTAGGQWVVVDGVLRQTAGGEDVRAVTGDPTWTDYTFTLKARKLSGEEGFLVLFRTARIDNPIWWNIGGWRNSEHSLQGEGMTERHVPGAIEANRWYDIRLELRGGSVKAYLDGKLIHEADRKPVSRLYATAGRDDRAHEIVLQLVNPFAEPITAAIRLNGLSTIGSRVQTTTLADANPDTENTLEQPDAIKPRAREFSPVGPVFTHALEPHSLTTLRIPER